MYRKYTIELELSEEQLKRLTNALTRSGEVGLADLLYSNAQEIDEDDTFEQRDC